MAVVRGALAFYNGPKLYSFFNVIFKFCMGLTGQQVSDICSKYGRKPSVRDTGSPEVQVALFTARINYLTEYLKANRKDHATKRSLVKMVGKRKSQLDYVKSRDVQRYRDIIKDLGLRR